MGNADEEIPLLQLVPVAGDLGGDSVAQAGVERVEDDSFYEGLVASGDAAEGGEHDGEVGVRDGVVEGVFGWAGGEAGRVHVRREDFT